MGKHESQETSSNPRSGLGGKHDVAPAPNAPVRTDMSQVVGDKPSTSKR